MVILHNTENTASALYSGVAGLASGKNLMHQASANLNHANREHIDLHKNVINLHVAEVQVKASAEVIRVANGTIGTIIDTFA